MIDEITEFLMDMLITFGIAAGQVLIFLTLLTGGMGLVDQLPWLSVDIGLFLDEFAIPIFIVGIIIVGGFQLFTYLVQQ